MDLPCEDTDEAIKETIQRAENLVETPMAEKFNDQTNFLRTLAQNHNK